MTITERQKLILNMLEQNPNRSVTELARTLYVSEPTIRRDLTSLEKHGLVTRVYGGAHLTNKKGPADSEIPFFLREKERSLTKTEMGRRAASLVEDGMVLMLDGSTSAYNIVPFLTPYKDLIVVTSGAKTALALAELNINTYSTGGKMIVHSFSYVGEQAENFVRRINADILFFSCRALSDDGRMTDVSVEEVNLRRVMFGSAKKKVLLCDSSKLGKICFYNMGTLDEVDAVISDSDRFS
ncbi:MAG: DeoR/GlpR family DNA-binding transcription regulator [Eubacteriales bacterium]